MPLGAEILPPAAYMAFCSRRPHECDLYEDARLQPSLTLKVTDGVAALVEDPAAPCISDTGLSAKAAWAAATEINARINRAIAPRPDLKAYGIADYWDEPLEAGTGFGDCEDYALEKRRALIAAGMPRAALALAVVATANNRDHVVLLASIGGREYVLDNLKPEILPWDQAGYRWIERQANGASPAWVKVL